MEHTKRISKNALMLIVANVFNNLLTFVLLFVMARVLGDVIYGKYIFALTLSMFFSVFADFGLSMYLIREISRKRRLVSKYIGNATFIKSLFSVISFGLLCLIVNLLGYPSDTLNIVYVVGLYSLVESIALVYRSTFKAYEKMEYEALVIVVYKIATVVLGLGVLFSGYDVMTLLFVFLILSVLYLIFTFTVGVVKFAKPRFRLDLILCKQMLRESFPFMVTALLVTVYYKIDIVMLSVMKGDEIVGWYGAATTMIYALVFIPVSFSESIYPRMSMSFKRARRMMSGLYHNSLRFIVMIAVPMMIGTTLLARDFVVLLFSEEYLGAVVAIQLLVWGLGVLFVNQVLAVTVNSVDKQHINTSVAFAGALLNVVLNLILIPYYGLQGACYATIVTQFMMMVVLYVYLRRFVKARLFEILIKPTIAAAIMGLVVYYLLPHVYFLLNMIIGVIVYIVVLYIINGINSEDVDVLKKLFLR